MNQDRLMQETVEDGSFFCFQGADFEVHPAKIIQTEVAFCKTEVKFAIYHNSEECSFLIGKNVLNHKILVRKNVEYTIDLIGKNVVNYIM